MGCFVSIYIYAPVYDLGQFIDSDSMESYDAKSIEYETSNRASCAKPGCSAILNTDAIVGNRALHTF